METITNRITRVRKEAGLKKKELALRLGVVPSVVSQVELGRRKPQNSFIKCLCHAFAINETWLRTGEGPMRRAAPAQATCSGCDKVLNIDSHQALVGRFRQKEVAEKINRILLDIERLDPARLPEIAAELAHKRDWLRGFELEKKTVGDNQE